MKRPLLFVSVNFLILLSACQKKAPEKTARSGADYKRAAAGSTQCRDCHAAFYAKWATGHHGLAMQPFTLRFAKSELTPQGAPIKIGAATYQVVTADGETAVEERGRRAVHRYPIRHVLGGKNVYYFLTPMDRGRLQTLPLAYDIAKKQWYDMAASGVRLHAGNPTDQPLSWTDSLYTFNTSCYSCHVSQLQTNYDVASDTYHTTWREPGINCETCHGDGAQHIALFQKDPGTNVPDMKIIRITAFTSGQRNEMCAPCHAKMSPISAGYQVRQRFFDHYDLATLEDHDYYPDGRDLGENYTYTSWLMSPCVKDAKMDCVVCHASSGRYRFATGDANGACSGCHSQQASNLAAHTHHRADGPAGRCIACHMPKTRFANMNRSDHSMRPPAPGATVRFKSPNACNGCHTERSPQWADVQVRQWYSKDYQKPVLERGALIEAARNRDWSHLPKILAYLQNPTGDVVFQASLLRMLPTCEDPSKWPVIRRSLKHPHPLVRAAAAEALRGDLTTEGRDALLTATRDEYRLVRVRAATSLSLFPQDAIPPAARAAVLRATDEFLTSVVVRPDDFSRYTTLGGFYLDRGEVSKATQSFETAIRLRPDSVPTLVNASVAYGRAGRAADAERVLEQALRYAPDNAAANFNLGLLLFELKRPSESEAALLRAWKTDSTMAPVAFNLCVMQSEQKKPTGLDYCRAAARLSPRTERYAYTLAYYLAVSGSPADSIRVLESFRSHDPAGIGTLLLLGDLCLNVGDKQKSKSVFAQALQTPGLDEPTRRLVQSRLAALDQPGRAQP
jgi:cytochrome c-type biogenesis protein CcmH/NrfG